MSIEIPRRAAFDIESTADDFRDVFGQRAADNFVNRVTRTLELLERFPEMGEVVDPPYPRHPGMRRFGVSDQPHYALYYVPTPTGVRAVRVLHTSRDADAIFG